MLQVASRLLQDFGTLDPPVAGGHDIGTAEGDEAGVRANDADDPEGLAGAFKEWSTHAAMEHLVLARCVQFLDDTTIEVLQLPSFLTSEVREQVHTFAKENGLVSRTLEAGSCGLKGMELQRSVPADIPTGASEPQHAPKERFPVDPLWHKRPFKGDGRHWIALWFAMGNVASGSLFSFFYVMTSNAI